MNLESFIRNVEDFPIPGVHFKDITPLLRHPAAFAHSIEVLVEYCRDQGVTDIVAPDARGFIWGAPVAYALGAPLHLVRKPGKLPPPFHSAEYDLEYGHQTLALSTLVSFGSQRIVCVLDDVNASGGTAAAVEGLVRQAGANNIVHACVIDLTFLTPDAVDLPDSARPFSVMALDR